MSIHQKLDLPSERVGSPWPSRKSSRLLLPGEATTSKRIRKALFAAILGAGAVIAPLSTASFKPTHPELLVNSDTSEPEVATPTTGAFPEPDCLGSIDGASLDPTMTAQQAEAIICDRSQDDTVAVK